MEGYKNKFGPFDTLLPHMFGGRRTAAGIIDGRGNGGGDKKIQAIFTKNL